MSNRVSRTWSLLLNFDSNFFIVDGTLLLIKKGICQAVPVSREWIAVSRKQTFEEYNNLLLFGMKEVTDHEESKREPIWQLSQYAYHRAPCGQSGEIKSSTIYNPADIKLKPILFLKGMKPIIQFQPWKNASELKRENYISFILVVCWHVKIKKACAIDGYQILSLWMYS